MISSTLYASDDGILVLFSGGQDSAICLAWALSRFLHVETIGFAYGQRHAVELDCRQTLLSSLLATFPAWETRLGPDHVFDLPLLEQISDTALTRDSVFTTAVANNLPPTFVPGRNLLFFIYAAAFAWRRNIQHLAGGMCEADYSGYPDCRDDTIKALQVTINLGMARRFVLHTPLMQLGKVASWRLAESIGGIALVELIRVHTHSCYFGDHTHYHNWGYGCGSCLSCCLRAAGWESYEKERSSVIPITNE